MINLDGTTLLLGGFHDHWIRADKDNPSLLLAALNYYHYDFMTLQDGRGAAQLAAAAAAFSNRIRLYDGQEETFGWGHVVTVGSPAAPLPPNETDIDSVLSRLKKTCALVILAHPSYPGTWDAIFKTGRMDQLLDDGLLDGINLINDKGFDDPRHRELIDWYRARQAAGKRTPIVGGWDVHMVAPIRNLPPVLYGAQQSPKGHLDSCGHNRTILFASENSLAAICQAVRAGRTVIEDLATGELLGPPALVEFLQTHGYRQTVAHLDEQRDAVSLHIPSRWIVGSPASLSVNRAGTIRLAKTFTQSIQTSQPVGQPVQLSRVPALLERDTVYLPVGWSADDGTERIWAVEATHPVRIEVLPWLGAGGPAVELRPKAPVDGTFALEVEGLLDPIRGPITERTLVPVDAARMRTDPRPYRLTVTTASGLARTQAGHLTFVGVKRFKGDWSAITSIGVDRPQYVPRYNYGVNRPYPGPEHYAAWLQLAWTPTELLLRATVRDAVHFQPYHGHFLYNADCLQLALDPMLRRSTTIGDVYVFNMALTDRGPECYRWLSPASLCADGFTPPAADVSLGDRYLNVAKSAQGLIYTLRLPWHELSPLEPAAGKRLGIYYVMFNNNGQGHLDTMHWPVPIDGLWTCPDRWGVIELLADGV